MSEESPELRRRAANCRDLAQRARDSRDRDMLKEIADELDAEADKMDRDGTEPGGGG
jgi:hypothetical protein